MITAEQARQISGPTIEELCEFFSPRIESAAKNGERQALVFHGDLEYEAYKNTQKWELFRVKMQEYGYNVSLFYKESQFVDMRIQINW